MSENAWSILRSNIAYIFKVASPQEMEEFKKLGFSDRWIEKFKVGSSMLYYDTVVKVSTVTGILPDELFSAAVKESYPRKYKPKKVSTIPFTAILKNISSYHGLVGNDMAEMLGIAGSTYNQWMRGTRKPRVSVAQQIASTFELSLNQVFGFDGLPYAVSKPLSEKDLKANPRLKSAGKPKKEAGEEVKDEAEEETKKKVLSILEDEKPKKKPKKAKADTKKYFKVIADAAGSKIADAKVSKEEPRKEEPPKTAEPSSDLKMVDSIVALTGLDVITVAKVIDAQRQVTEILKIFSE